MEYWDALPEHMAISHLDQDLVGCGSHPLCAKCEEKITDKYMLELLQKHWHVGCLRCVDCFQLLNSTCFVRDGDILCQYDFFRRYGKKCSICQEGISPRQPVRKVHERVYHISCFTCTTCNRQLGTGDLFYLGEDGRVMCKSDYEQAQVAGDCEPSSEMTREKRKRTFINMSQLSTLKTAYKTCPKPTIEQREQIAGETGLDMRVVQVWFQNRRAKDKRISNRGKFPWLDKFPSKAPSLRERSLSWSSGCMLDMSGRVGGARKNSYTEEDIAEQVCNLHVSSTPSTPNSVELDWPPLPPKLKLQVGLHQSNCFSAPTSPFLHEANSGGMQPVFTFPTLPVVSAPELAVEIEGCNTNPHNSAPRNLVSSSEAIECALDRARALVSYSSSHDLMA